MNSVVFRVDSSTNLGGGHVMRCIALADELKRRGMSSHFICRSLPGNVSDRVLEAGHAVHWIPGDGDFAGTEFAGMETGKQAAQFLEVVRDAGLIPGWIVVDHYGIDAEWERGVRALPARILVIDDLANRIHDCDVILDQNLYASPPPYEKLMRGPGRVLLGPRYALLRSEFREVRAEASPREGYVRRILVMFGSTDPTNCTALALQAISALGRSDLAIDVVLGTQGKSSMAIEIMAKGIPGASVAVRPHDLARRMARADLAIGAGGVNLWERCALGLPALALPVALNQKEQIRQAGLHAAVVAPEANSIDSPSGMSKHLEILLATPTLLTHVSQRAWALCDGAGAARVANAMVADRIMVRRAQEEDAALALEWRNSVSVRESSLNPEPIAWNDHIEWFRAALSAPNRILLMAIMDARPVGVLRYDVAETRGEVSIYMDPSLHGNGYGSATLEAGERWLRQNRPEVIRLLAIVMAGNSRSGQMFASQGYTLSQSQFVKDLEVG